MPREIPASADSADRDFQEIYRCSIEPALAQLKREDARRVCLGLAVFVLFSMGCAAAGCLLGRRLDVIGSAVPGAGAFALLGSGAAAVSLIGRGVRKEHVTAVIASACSASILLILSAGTDWMAAAAAAAAISAVLAGLFHSHFLNVITQKHYFERVILPLADHAVPGMRPCSFDPYEFADSGLVSGPEQLQCTYCLDADGPEYRFGMSWLGPRNSGKDTTEGRWLFRIVFPRAFACGIRIEPDVLEAVFGWLGRSMQRLTEPYGMQLVELENPEFERIFKVLAADQVHSRCLITPVFMEAAVRLRSRLPAEPSFSFEERSLYVLCPGLKPKFAGFQEPDLSDPEPLRLLYAALAGTTTLADTAARSRGGWREDSV